MPATEKGCKKGNEKKAIIQHQLRCDACHRPITKERSVLTVRQHMDGGVVYKKALPVGSSGGGMVVSLGTTCARKYGIVYTDDDL